MKGIFFIVSLLVLFVVFSLISLLLPSTVVIASQAMVRAPVAKVRQQVENFAHWPGWNDAFNDSAVSIRYLTPDSSRVELKDDRKTILFDMLQPKEDTITVEVSSDDFTRVFYQFTFIDRETIHSNIMLHVIVHLKWYPWERVKGLFMQKMAASFYESMVERIKLAAETDEYSNH